MVPAQEHPRLAVPGRAHELRRGGLPVLVRIRDTERDTSLFPKDGCYIVPGEARARSAERLDDGDTADADAQGARAA